MKMLFIDCKTEEERQKLRDFYLETIYHQTIIQNGMLSKIQEKLDMLSKMQVEECFESMSGSDIVALFNKE